ncbi:phosphotransferase family protein [Glycomyces sp. YM15]|uniref:phosphotransferase family protein n=1 Tax=Glycomyces sp. YM15 TaxID=2800446 RepID=UPI001964C704|nr:phosphotransferase [Glycomyces sp. YM15]
MEQIGGGRASQVFALDDRKVLRRGPFDAAAEARLMRYLHDLGFPVPEVFAADGAEMTMQRLNGRTLGAEVGAGTIGVPEAAKILLDLHDRLHEIDAPRFLASSTREFEMARAGTRKVLHLDLHPENVIITDDGPFLIDWTNATAGDPEYDLAVSWAIIAGIDVTELGPDTAAQSAWFEAARAGLLTTIGGRTSRPALDIAVAYRTADPNTNAAEAARLHKALNDS